MDSGNIQLEVLLEAGDAVKKDPYSVLGSVAKDSGQDTLKSIQGTPPPSLSVT